MKPQQHEQQQLLPKHRVLNLPPPPMLRGELEAPLEVAPPQRAGSSSSLRSKPSAYPAVLHLEFLHPAALHPTARTTPPAMLSGLLAPLQCSGLIVTTSERRLRLLLLLLQKKMR